MYGKTAPAGRVLNFGCGERGESDDKRACRSVRRRPHTWTMAGSLVKRQRRRELRCIQPRIPMHQWRSFSDAEKIVAIFGMSFDELARTHVDPIREADLHERNLKLRVFECMMKAGLQFTRDRGRVNARNEVLEAGGQLIR